jgi:hypothetical protein
MRYFLLMLFAVAGGLTLSGIVANAYRLLAKKPQSGSARWIFYAVILVAGPSVLFKNSTRSFRKKGCSRAAYGFAVAVAGYWAFMLGVVMVDVGLNL